MTAPHQQTLAAAVSLDGIGLHTGQPARLELSPADAGTGRRFRRTDLKGQPEIPADVEHVSSTDRGTTIAAGEAEVRTIEHLMAALGALEVDNVRVDLSGPEIPIADGSFRAFHDLIARAGRETQQAPVPLLELTEPLQFRGSGGASYAVIPADEFRVSATIEFDHPLVGRQFASVSITPETFDRDIAPARTFGFAHEAEALRRRGLALGASVENAIILDETGLSGGELRFPDEFVRHKIGDIIGDLALFRGRLKAHVIAERPSHEGNIELVRELTRQVDRARPRPIVDIQQIMQYLPHRYPMLLVDRIIDFEAGKRIVGIKNVSINEPFFQGHYPGHPIMPGVLIIEAMAQVGGLLLMDVIENPEDKVVYFMSLDNVKWRRPVTPGDQIRFELEVVQLRRHVCKMRGIGYVDGHVIAEADMMARIVDR